MTAETVFWIAAAWAAWAFAGYPAVAITLGRLRDTDPSPGLPWQPAVTVVMAVRDEAGIIRRRLENLLQSDYPADRLEILVVDDGSRDDTAAIAESLSPGRIRVIRQGSSRGKAAALNAGMAGVRTPVTVFADARQHFAPDAISELVNVLAGPDTGAVAGRLRLTRTTEPDSADAASGTGLYWRIENALREAECRLGWAHGVSGAIYALHTPLFRELPEGLILDDMYTPLEVLRQGLRVRMAPGAVAREPAGTENGREFRRKLRTLAGNWQLIGYMPWLLSPVRNPVWFAWFSHKFARLLAPWALLTALVASGLAQGPLMQALFWLQVTGYGLAIAAVAAPGPISRIPVAGTAGSFLLLNLAALLSLPALLRQRDAARLWKR